MAGDWIKMRTDLPEDPAVFKLRTITKLDRHGIVGRLYAFWCWADKHAVDGRVDGASSTTVDDVVQFEGFATAMQAVKWLEIGEDYVAIPKHDRHNGESAKERSLKNQRQARWRAGKKPVGAHVDERASTSPSTREEKRREELKLVPPSPPTGKVNGNGQHRERKKPATRAPGEFEITEPMWVWAQEQGVPNQRIEAETAKFLDHHKAKGSLFSDWPAAWRKWMRNVVDFAARAH